MELIDGEDLATILRRSGALPPRQVARIGVGVARALAAAHARGLVHRDIKPGNVLIGSDGAVKVADFGIARAVAEAQVTLPGTTLGSVHYFSPEQARGEPATTASDVYSLGIVLYEMLTGSRPFEGDSAASVALARLTGPIPDPAAVRPSVPADLASITRRALALDPKDRWPSAAVMADALDATLAPGGGAAAGVAGAAAAGAAAGAAGAAGPGEAGDTSGSAAGAAAAGALVGATVVSATARPNPAAIPYAPDAYVGADGDTTTGSPPPPSGTTGGTTGGPDDDGKTSPLVWVAGIVAILLLAAIAFLVFQLTSGGTRKPDQVVVPNLVGQTSAAATAQVAALGLTLTPTGQVSSDQPDGTVLSQDPPAGTKVDAGSVVKVNVATGPGTVPVPSITNLDESSALQALSDAGLRIGVRTEAFDPTIAVGLVSAQSPSGGIVVAKGTPVDYTISKGPEPTPSPTPTPTPTPASRAGGGCWPQRWTPASRSSWCGTVRCWSHGSPPPDRRAARQT
jgi:serine/threonine-protein kinase